MKGMHMKEYNDRGNKPLVNDAVTQNDKISIIRNSLFGNQRIEVTLSNKVSFTIFVNEKTGKVSLLSDQPLQIGTMVDIENGYPACVSKIDHYGYPTD